MGVFFCILLHYYLRVSNKKRTFAENNSKFMEIPQIISTYAKRCGFNTINYLKTVGGVEYYSFGYVDEDGNTPPIGLPFVIEYKDGNISHILEEEVIWELLS